jgi:hypothetical protein
MNVHVVTIIVERDINIIGELINITIAEPIRTIIIIVIESILIITNRTTIIVAIEVMISLLLQLNIMTIDCIHVNFIVLCDFMLESFASLKKLSRR